jgi:kynureninase
MAPDREACRRLDAVDPLRDVRARFVVPERGVYLAANSLGPLPVAAKDRLVRAATEAWGEGLVRSWSTAGWFDLPRTLGAKLAPVLGAAPGDVLVTDTISLNLFKLVAAMRTRSPQRPHVLVEAGAFPSDRYVVTSAAGPGNTVDLRSPTDIDAALADPRVGLVVLGHVDYASSFRWDIAAVTKKIHAAGAQVVWDLAHSTGVMDLALAAWDVDAAVGCTYKYLSGGPGAPGFLYVSPRIVSELQQPLAGWWGHERPFAMAADYVSAPGIARFLCGTQPVLSMVALDAALDAVADVDWGEARRKSERLCAIFIDGVRELAARHPIAVAGPTDAAARGSHVSVEFHAAYEVVQALIARGVIGDYRPPVFARFGFSPLFTSHEDAWVAANELGEVLETEAWRESRFAVRRMVT